MHMKKLFTLILGAALAVSAQAGLIINVTGYGEISGDSLEIVVNEATVNPLTDEMQMKVEGTILVTSEALAVSIFRSEEGMEDEFCCGGDCRAGNGQTADRAAFDASTWSGPQNWYVHFTPKASGANVAVRYLFSDGTVQKQLIVHFVYEGSGIEDVEADSKAPQGVYTLFGQKLRTDNSTEGLPAGMYIVGGKKMIVK